MPKIDPFWATFDAKCRNFAKTYAENPASLGSKLCAYWPGSFAAAETAARRSNGFVAAGIGVVKKPAGHMEATWTGGGEAGGSDASMRSYRSWSWTTTTTPPLPASEALRQ